MPTVSAKMTTYTVRDMMSYDLLRKMSTLTYRRYVPIGVVTLRQTRLLDVLEEYNGQLSYSQCFGWTLPDDMKSIKSEDANKLFLIHAGNLVIHHQNYVF